jgi:hypothetical protein
VNGRQDRTITVALVVFVALLVACIVGIAFTNGVEVGGAR